MVFESVLVAEAGPTFYKSYLEGKEAADAPQIKATLESVAKMLDYSDLSRGGKGWTDSVADVCNENAAMIILPDFIKGEFTSKCPNTAVDYVAMQGDKPTFVFVGIAFPLVVGAPHRDMAVEFLKAVGSKEGQDAFNPTKGSVGVRTDLNKDELDDLSKKTLLEFEATAKDSPEGLVPAYAAITSSAFQEAVNPALQKFCDPAAAEHKDVDAMILALRQAYPALAQ
jgi:glucose/mannose transport system substrate-binding protein